MKTGTLVINRNYKRGLIKLAYLRIPLNAVLMYNIIIRRSSGNVHCLLFVQRFVVTIVCQEQQAAILSVWQPVPCWYIVKMEPLYYKPLN